MYDLSGDLGLTVLDDLPEAIVRMKERLFDSFMPSEMWGGGNAVEPIPLISVR